jgi:hypothetical protein
MSLDQRRQALQQQIAGLEPDAILAVEGFVADLLTAQPQLIPGQQAELNHRAALAADPNTPTLSPDRVRERARYAWAKAQAAKG